MSIVDNAATRNGSPQRTAAPEPALLAQPGITHSDATLPPDRAGQDALQSSDRPATPTRHRLWNSRLLSDAPTIDDARRNAVHFFWAWLLLATGVSIGGNFLHSWLTAPAGMRTWAPIAAVKIPTILLGATHSVALLIKGRRRNGWPLVDAIVLGAALVLTIAVAVCAFTMSFFSLTDLMVMLGISPLGAKLWPIAVDPVDRQLHPGPPRADLAA